MNKAVRLSTSEKIGLIDNLATMLGAGIPILDAVDSTMADTKGNTRRVLESLRADLMQGKPLSVSFAAYPNAFDVVTVSLLKAAETAGTLETTLRDLKDHIQKETEFMDKVKLALVYPVLIGIVFLGVMMVILLVVVPKIATVFSRLNVELPLPTRIMIVVSDLLIKNTVGSLTGVVIFFFLLWLSWRFYRRQILSVFFSLPLISTLIKNIDLTRFTRTLHLLLAAGLPIDVALQLAQGVVLRHQTSLLIAHSRELVLAGKKLGDGLKTGGRIIPSMVTKLIEAGEKSGTLDKSLLDISIHLDYEVSNTLKTLTSVLEPVMLLVVGLSVGGMMLAIIAPIYGLIGQVSSR